MKFVCAWEAQSILHPSHPEVPYPSMGSQAGERMAAAGKAMLAQKAFGVHLYICTAIAPRLVCRSFLTNQGILLI